MGTARVTCSLGTVPAGEVVIIELPMSAPTAAVAPGSNFSNTATVTGTTADPNLANNTATAADPVATLADISLTKTGPANFTAGANGNYTFRIAKRQAHRWGGRPSQRHRPPSTAGLTFVSASLAQAGAAPPSRRTTPHRLSLAQSAAATRRTWALGSARLHSSSRCTLPPTP